MSLGHTPLTMGNIAQCSNTRCGFNTGVSVINFIKVMGINHYDIKLYDLRYYVKQTGFLI